jgi:Family of unknown function (DUF6134)
MATKLPQSNGMKIIRCGLLVIALAGSLASASQSDVARQLMFDVFLDSKPIGYHRFDLAPRTDGYRIETEAAFRVRILGVSVFKYEHRNREEWQGSCLVSMNSSTNDDGTQRAVNGTGDSRRFAVTSNGNKLAIQECVGSYAYWDLAQLQSQQRFLNPQTGEHQTLVLSELGAQSLKIGSVQHAVKRYALRGEDVDITLSYCASRPEWIALDAKLKGRTLQYRRRGAINCG